MFNYFLSTTDEFICTNMKNIFEKLEINYKKKNIKINLYKELKNLEFDPFININHESSDFERSVKFKLKVTIGIFFVLIPLSILLGASYFIGIQITYAFLITFIVAIFASTRTTKIASRYSKLRDSTH